MAYTAIQQVRLEVADIDPTLPILSDTDYEYFLSKNNNSITRASIDAARTILLVLSQRGEETVDLFSIKGSKAAEQYRLALQLFLTSPSTNPVLQNAKGWVGGTSYEDIQTNLANPDNNLIRLPREHPSGDNSTLVPRKYF